MQVNLFDMNSIFSRNFFNAIKDGVPTNSETVDGIPIYALERTVKTVFNELKICRAANLNPTHVICVFDDPGETFRHQIYPPYKANRPPKPEHFHEQLKLCIDMMKGYGFYTIQKKGFESDDVIATIASKLSKNNITSVIHTGDKDALSLVNPNTIIYSGAKKRFINTSDVISEFGVEPRLLLDLLALMGDSVDNIPGITGVGEKTAAQMLQHARLVDMVNNPDVLVNSKIRNIKAIVEEIKSNPGKLKMARVLVGLRKDIELDFNLKQTAYTSKKQPNVTEAIMSARRYG